MVNFIRCTGLLLALGFALGSNLFCAVKKQEGRQKTYIFFERE